MCLCPNEEPDCVHARFLAQFGREEFPDDEDLPVDLGPIRLVFRDLSEGRHLFSVETPGKHGIKPHALVQHEGSVDGGGAWRCSKDGGQGCGHIQKARDYLQQLILMDPSVRDTTELHGQAVQLTGMTNGTSSVSFKSIVPPIWAQLATDLPLPYARPPPLTTPPTLIRLEEDARCKCGASRNSETPVVTNTCRIYTILGSFDTAIELQRCTQCTGGRHRFVGPDCCQVGLFNYNNRILLSHDLLDEYTMAYTSSETPFTAWISIAARRYKVHDSQNPFLGETVFRAAWFSYACLLALDGDFQCSRCGPVPHEPIFDGVVVAFSKRKILHSLCPPTTTHDDSDIRQSRLISDKAPIPKAKLRKNVRLIVDGPPLIIAESDDQSDDENDSDEEESGDETEEPDSTPLRRMASKKVRQRMALIPSVVSELLKLDAALGALFKRHYYDNRTSVPLPYKRFFMQMSSRESILQVANQLALEALGTFNADPTLENMSLLLEIPCLYHVLIHEQQKMGIFSSDTLGVCQYIHDRGLRTLGKLKGNTGDVPSRIFSTPETGKEWMKSGSFYSMPKIRHRPNYPLIPKDSANDFSGQRSAHCSKYYARYSQQRMTGGIMAVWCTHSICYGFHVIPSGEGRNDVFSALITHWEKAPRIVVYDFACALGPYCLTREPEFFANTLFVVDDFHSDGHTCGAATTLKAYCEVDLRLSRINSSAAECGNGGLAQIKKSVSYMTQEHAIIYTKVFISVWNRLKLVKMAKA
ncbi:hypothetical protein H0H92_012733 [Tricholoma furcatifolium]|nr:hypothetical protein H0H92_012733 [Tricholoma furcatifolium]